MNNELAICIAMSLYQYNVSPFERAEKLYAEFNGVCAEIDDLISMVDNKNWATEMAAPTALKYLEHGLEKYGKEARERVEINLSDF